jgi:hypothetical protein
VPKLLNGVCNLASYQLTGQEGLSITKPYHKKGSSLLVKAILEKIESRTTRHLSKCSKLLTSVIYGHTVDGYHRKGVSK